MGIPLQQTKLWQSFLADLGETSFFHNEKSFTYLAILKSTPFGNYLYCPYGPYSDTKSGFKKAIHQGCKIVVIDLNEHLKDKKLQTHNLSKELANRFRDFHDGIISDCYIIYHDKAIRLDVEDMPTDPTLTKGKDKGIRQAHIEDLLQKIAT